MRMEFHLWSKVKVSLLLALTVPIVVACSESAEEAVPKGKPVTKIAEIYFRYGTEAAARSGGAWNDAKFRALMNSETVRMGARCVQNNIVSKGIRPYRETRLQSLFLKHVFPNELSSYSKYMDEVVVHQTALVRLQKLGFASFDAAVKSNNLIVRSLLTEYTQYASFRKLHDVSNGVQPKNTVMKVCAPEGLTAMLARKG